MSTFLALVVVFSCLLQAVVALDPLVIKGYKFFDSGNGKNFNIKGVAYYPRPNAGELNVNNFDFFTDEYEAIWTRDIPHLKKAGVNAIRIYAVDPSKNHDKFMCQMAFNGIYVIVGLAARCTDCAITKSPAPACYPKALKTRGQMIINTFAKYKNVLGFSAGNEINHVVSEKTPEVNGVCQKKFIRDMRKYISECKTMRDIPVGVVLADTARDLNAKFYNCRSDPNDVYENAEWYGINPYLHCDHKVSDVANAIGIQNIYKDFKGYKYSIPVILTEYGCLNVGFPTVNGYEAQRTFLQSKWIMEAPFTDVFAGGFVFEYSTELQNAKADSPYPFTKFGPQNYGLGYFSPESCDDVNTPCKYNPMPNYHNLAKYYVPASSTNALQKDAFTPDPTRTSPTTCPAQFKKLSDFKWEADSVNNEGCTENVCHLCAGDTKKCVFKKGENTSKGNGDNGKNGDSNSSVQCLSSFLYLTFVAIGFFLF